MSLCVFAWRRSKELLGQLGSQEEGLQGMGGGAVQGAILRATRRDREKPLRYCWVCGVLFVCVCMHRKVPSSLLQKMLGFRGVDSLY